MADQRYSYVDVSGVTGTHARAVARLLGGSRLMGSSHTLSLPVPMTGAEVRRKLGVLWRGVCLR